MAAIIWTAEAQRWLEDIFEYIDGDNPAAAAATVQGIYERAQSLAEFPLLGQRYAPSPQHVRILLALLNFEWVMRSQAGRAT